ncbi:MAG: peptidoglycan DD-metalloendopeptidase family protein [Candidatus Aminicenantes bacterium]|nr:peptidoglycan DD-metalloendopeptidase family protein [Candidatus Aminicenantes bacterium]
MRKVFFLLFFISILPLLSSSDETIIIWRWPFDSQPQFDKKEVIRRHGSDWFKEGWAIPQDGAFGASRQGEDGVVPHYGIDILANEGEDFKSIVEGYVYRFKEYNEETGKSKEGNTVYVYCPNLENPQYIIMYMHLKDVEPIFKLLPEQLPKHVGFGEKIGTVGKTGNAKKDKDGPHLHLQIERLDGTAIDPLSLLPDFNSPNAEVNYVISDSYGDKNVYSKKLNNLWSFPAVNGNVILGFEIEDDSLVRVFSGETKALIDPNIFCVPRRKLPSRSFTYVFNPNFYINPNPGLFNYYPEWKGVFLRSFGQAPSPNPEDLEALEMEGVSPDQFDLNPFSLMRFSFNTTLFPNGGYYLETYALDFSNNEASSIFPFQIKNREEDKASPGCENPDDNFSFAEPFVSNYILTSDVIRTAVKKEKIIVLKYVGNEKKYLKTRSELNEYIKNIPPPEEEGDPCDDEITDPVYLEYLNDLRFIYSSIQSFAPLKDKLIEECADVALLWHGKYHSTMSFLSDLHIPSKLIDPDLFSPLLVNEYPVLVIPTGGLYGLDNAEQFKAALEQYAASGGTILTFTQKYGYEFAMLPTPGEIPLASYGWKEDQSCHSNSIYVGTYHPALSAVTTSLVTSPVDGYLTKYPSSSTVLLRRRVSGMPAMIVYPYGQGRVVVTSLYEDWGYTHWQSTAQGRAIIRDLINWAKDFSSDIPEYNLRSNPTPEVSLNLEVKNLSEKAAVKAKILWLYPDLKLHFEEEKPISLPAGGEATLSVSHTLSDIPDNKLGIWHVDYSLYDSDGNEIQPQAETDSGRFILSRPPTEVFEVSDITVNVTTPDEEVSRGSQVSFKAHFTNRSAQEKRFHFWWDLSHRKAEYGGKIAVPGDSSLTEEILVDLQQLYSGSHRFWLHVFEENGEGIYRSLTRMGFRVQDSESWPYVGSASKGIKVLPARMAINAQTGKELYHRGEAVNITLNLKNLNHFGYGSTINLRMTDPFNQLIHQNSWSQHLAFREEAVISESFTLPQDSDIGIYYIYVEALDHKDVKIGSSHSLFELLAFQIKSEVQLPSILQPNSSNTVSFVLTNIGEVAVSEGIIDVKLLDPEEQSVFQVQQGFSLAPDQSTTFNFNVPLSDIKFGDYKLFYPISSEYGIRNPVEIIVPSEIEIDLGFDKISYRMRDEMNLSLDIKNSGRFFESLEATVSIVSFPYSESKSITLNPGGEGNLSFSTVVPINVGSGLHPVEVALKLPSGSEVKKTVSFSIPVSALSITSDKTEYVAGEDLSFQIANPGGVDTPFEYEVKLIELKHKIEIHNGSGTGVIQAGAVIPLSFTIPAQAVDGNYFLKIGGTDNSTGKKGYHGKDIVISGIEADLEVNTDKDIYLNTEQISSLSKIINSDEDITDGALHLQVLSKELGKDKWNHYVNPLGYGISSIVIDKENNMWFGTYGGGVSIFEGTNWTTYNTSNSGLAGDSVQAIAEDSGGNLWFGTWDGGVSRFDGTNWTTYDTSNSGLAYDRVRSVAIDSAGNLWFGTYGGGASKFDGTSWTTYNSSNSGLTSDKIRPVAIDSGGNLWFGTWGGGVSKFDGTNWTTYNKSNSGLDTNYIYSIAEDSEGNIWIGTWLGGVSKFDGTNWKTYKKSNSGLEEDRVYSVTIDSGGNLWFGTYGGGASKFDGTNWTTYNTSSNNSAGDYVYSITVDSEENVWFGTPSGFCKFDGTNWTHHTELHPGISTYEIWSITIDKEGDIWFGTWFGGASRFDGTNWTSYHTSNSGIATNHITSIAVGSAGNIWFGAWWGGVSKFDGTNWTTYNTSNSGLVYEYVNSIAVDLAGNIWFGTNNGVSKFDGANWTTYNTSNSGLARNYINSIAVDLAGNIWFGTNNGVSKFDGTNWTTYKAYYSGLVDNSVNSVAVDSTGNLWFGTRRGVDKFDGANWTTYDIYNSELVDNWVTSVAFDLEGNIWFGTWYGVSKFDGADWTTYDVSNSGLSDYSVNSVSVDSKGNLWFGTETGVFNLIEGKGGKSLWEKDIVINQGASETQELTTEIGQLDLTGKFFLQGKLESSTGQTVSEAEYPFYVTESNEVLLFSPDKAVYKQGETVSILGEVKNLASAEAPGLTLSITKESVEPGSVPEEVYSDTFSVPAGDSHPFSFTISGDEEGTYVLTGAVTQNTEEISKASELYEVLSRGV